MKVIGIHNLFDRKNYEFLYLEKYNDFQINEIVIFQNADLKEEAGRIVYIRSPAIDDADVIQDRHILRKLTPHDIQKLDTNTELSEEAKKIFIEKSLLHNLDMMIVDVVYSFDATGLNFIFTANDRVDFRTLVKDLAKTFQKQIHLQQIGPRDKAKIIGGFGKCGQQTCCSRFLNKLSSITMDMVRSQSLASKGSEKLSGLCGKLLCCLRYEVKQYEEFKKSLPDIGDHVIIKSGEEGDVISLDVLNNKFRLFLQDQSIKTFIQSDIKKIAKKAYDNINVKQNHVEMSSL